MRHHRRGEQLLGLDRLPVLGAAGVDRDRDLGQPRAELLHRLDPLDHVRRRPDPDDVAVDHRVVRRLRELLEDPGGVEAVAGRVQLVRRRRLVLRQRRGVALQEADHPLLRLALRDLAVLVDVAGVDPDDVRLGAVLGALRAVEVELLGEGRVRQQRRHDDGPAALRGELVRAVGGAAEEDAELPVRPRHDPGVGDLEVLAVVGEALVLERREEQLDRLLVALARLRRQRRCRPWAASSRGRGRPRTRSGRRAGCPRRRSRRPARPGCGTASSAAACGS